MQSLINRINQRLVILKGFIELFRISSDLKFGYIDLLLREEFIIITDDSALILSRIDSSIDHKIRFIVLVNICDFDAWTLDNIRDPASQNIKVSQDYCVKFWRNGLRPIGIGKKL